MKKLLMLLAFACLPIWAQVNTAPYPNPVPQFFTATGTPLSGGKVFSYSAGTTTPLATYTDATGLVQNANPIILNAAGYPVNASGSIVGIWLGPQKYKIVLQSSASVQQWLVDQVGGNNLFSLANLNMAESTAPTGNIGSDILWGDSTGHRFKMLNNNTAADFVVGQNTTDTLTNKTLISPALTTPTINSPTVTGTETHTGTSTFANWNGMLSVDGTTYTTVQAAINALPSTGGVVYLPPGTYVGPTMFRNNVQILATDVRPPSAVLHAANAIWLGISDQKVIFTYTAPLVLDSLQALNIQGVSMQFTGVAGTLLQLKGVTNSTFKNFSVYSTDNIGAWAIEIDGAGTTQVQQSSDNMFENFFTGGTNGGLLLSGAANQSNVVTWNQFNHGLIYTLGAGSTNPSIDIAAGADSNFFNTIMLTNPGNLTGGGGCLRFNSTVTPNSDVDANSNTFVALMCDPQIAVTHPVFQFNASNGNVILGATFGGAVGSNVAGEAASTPKPNYTIQYASNFGTSTTSNIFYNTNDIQTGGNLYFWRSKGQHIQTQAAGNDIAGMVHVAASTTVAASFTTAYTATPVCQFTPYTTGITSYYVSAISTTGFTLTVAPSGTYDFAYLCFANPN